MVQLFWYVKFEKKKFIFIEQKRGLFYYSVRITGSYNMDLGDLR